jgi:hypothetical protein
VQWKHLQPALVLDHVGVEHVRHPLDLLDRGEEDQDLPC